MIKVFYNCIAHLNIAAFNCNFVRLAESFFWHFIQYGVPGDYVSFFVFFALMACLCLHSQYLCCLFFVFLFSLLVLLGSRWSFLTSESKVSKFLFFLQKKICYCIFLFFDQLLFWSWYPVFRKFCTEMRISYLALGIMNFWEYICWNIAKSFKSFFNTSFEKFLFLSGKCFGKILTS